MFFCFFFFVSEVGSVVMCCVDIVLGLLFVGDYQHAFPLERYSRSHCH